MMRIYVDTAGWFVRPNNTDWRYTQSLREIEALQPDLHFHYPKGLANLVEVSGSHLRRTLRTRALRAIGKVPTLRKTDLVDYLSSRELHSSGADLVFSHRGFPINSFTPVVWQTSILDPIMRKARGESEQDISLEIALREELFKRSARVQVSTQSERIRLGETYPKLASKFEAVPFFLPYIEPLNVDVVKAKFTRTNIIKMLFVGRAANRKGLSLILDALVKLDFGQRGDFEFTIVSDFSDGPIVVPAWPNIRVLRELEKEDVQTVFAHSHVLLMPSLFESYGLVFVEALSKGCVPLGPRWEVQSEILDYGNAGFLCTPSPEGVLNEIQRVLEGGPLLLCKKAVRGLQLVEAKYSPSAVASSYKGLFTNALARA